MWIHMLAEPAGSPQVPTSIVLTATYGELHPGSSQVPICLRNLSACPVVIPTKVVIGKVTLANQEPPVVLSMGALAESTFSPKKDWILEELNLQGLEEWLKQEKDKARKLLVKWECLFAHNDLDLGTTSLIKHWIELTSRSTTSEYHPTCMMMQRPISRKCWVLVPSGCCTVHGLAL